MTEQALKLIAEIGRSEPSFLAWVKCNKADLIWEYCQDKSIYGVVAPHKKLDSKKVTIDQIPDYWLLAHYDAWLEYYDD